VAPEPVDQLTTIEPAPGEIEYEALLGIDGGLDLPAVEHQECLHCGMPNALVAIDERVALNQRQTQRRSLVSKSRIQLSTTERGPGLGDCRFQRPEVPNAGCAAGRLEEATMQFNDLPQRDVAHQARRRYSSWFFCSTRLAAASKSSSRVANRSATAARARSSGVSPRRSASWRSRSACAADRSIVTFMRVQYRVAGPSNNIVERTGPERPAAHDER